MKISIVTVCFNCEKEIEKTIKSVLLQEIADYEYIVKDGGSTDDTMNVVSKLLSGKENTKVITSKDNGIYDAMNMSVSECVGDYIFFLNAGDTLYDAKTISRLCGHIQELRQNPVMIYGGINLINSDGTEKKRSYGKLYATSAPYVLGLSLCHQALLTRREFLLNRLYDVKYRVCADREWQMYALNSEYEFAYIPIIFANMQVEGFSMNNLERYENEVYSCISAYYGRLKYIYKIYIYIIHKRKVSEIV